MRWFKNLNAMPKLMISFGVLFAIITFIGYQGVMLALQLNQKIDSLYTRDVVGLGAVKDVEVDKALIARCSRNAILDMAKKDEVASQEKEFARLYKKLEADLSTAESTETAKDVVAVLSRIRELLPVYRQSTDAVFEAVKRQDSEGAKAALKKASGGVIKALNSAVSEAATQKQANIVEAKKLAAAQFVESFRGMLFTLIGAIGFGSILALWLARTFSHPLIATVEVLRHVASGDLTHKLDIETRDEIGVMAKALNAAIDSVGSTLISVGQSSKNLTLMSGNLAKSASALALGTREQAAGLDETTSSMEQITVAVRHSSDFVGEADKVMSASRDAAQVGGEVVNSAVGAMQEISNSSRKIATIIAAIDDISFQTNLLAVNASIEAANAGEQGRGFAVVATEVRTLAQRSAKAAHEIRDLIDDSLQKVNNGSELVNRTGRTFNEIIASVRGVTTIVSDIAVSTREQTLGIEQVNNAMSRIDQVTQANSVQSEKISETAALVAEHASNLERLVAQFVVPER